MKSCFAKCCVVLLLLLLAACASLADPAVVEMLSLGQVDAVINLLLNRSDAESLNLISRAYYATEHWDDAVRTGERAVAMGPENANYHLWLGREYGQKAAIANPLKAATLARKAKIEFERAVALDPANLDARSDLSEYYIEAPVVMGGGLDKARDQAAQIAKLDQAMSHSILAEVAAKDKQYDLAENEYKNALRAAKNPAGTWLNLASFYRDRGRCDDAQRAVQTAMEQPTKLPNNYYDAADELFQCKRNFPAAVQYLKKYLNSGQLVEDAPAFRAHYLLGQIYQATGNRPAAQSEYEASLALASGFDPARKALDQLH